jgi:hypothetical protein
MVFTAQIYSFFLKKIKRLSIKWTLKQIYNPSCVETGVPEKSTDLPQVTEKLYDIALYEYTSP